MKKTPEQIAFARQLRRSQTTAERALWARLRNRRSEGVKFRRQQPIGPYIVDFISFQGKRVIEVDGGHHGESSVRDDLRSRWLNKRGYKVLRFWNNDVLANIEGVLETISAALRGSPSPWPSPLPPSPWPSPLQGEGTKISGVVFPGAQR